MPLPPWPQLCLSFALNLPPAQLLRAADSGTLHLLCLMCPWFARTGSRSKEAQRKSELHCRARSRAPALRPRTGPVVPVGSLPISFLTERQITEPLNLGNIANKCFIFFPSRAQTHFLSGFSRLSNRGKLMRRSYHRARDRFRWSPGREGDSQNVIEELQDEERGPGNRGQGLLLFF